MQVLVFLVEMLVVAGAGGVAIATVRQNGTRIIEAMAGAQSANVAAPLTRRVIRTRQTERLTPVPLRAAA